LKNKKYHTGRRVSKSKLEIIETKAKPMPLTHILQYHSLFLAWYISIKSGRG
jgi:hypothetical protein